jgi:hypothetical protein
MRRFTKLETRSPAIARLPTKTPDFRSEPDQRSACHRRQDVENDPADSSDG